MSELQAAMGLNVLPYMTKNFQERKGVVDFYNKNLNFEIIRICEVKGLHRFEL